MEQIINKKVNISLFGVDGNAFALLSVFSIAAKNQGWTAEEVQRVVDHATSSTYLHLVNTLASHIDEEFDFEEEMEDDFEEEMEDDFEKDFF